MERRQAAFSTHSIVDLIEQQVQHTPDAIALVCAENQLSFQCLDVRASRLASVLLSQGVEPEVRVGICLPHSASSLIALLAVLKAGGACMFLDPQSPPEELARIMQDAQTHLLLMYSTPGVRPTPGTDLQMLYIDTIIYKNQTGELARRAPHPANLAYLSTPSGSPVTVHRVMVTYANLRDACDTSTQVSQLPAQTTCHLQRAGFFAESWIGGNLRSLCSGGRLVICPQEILVEPARLFQLLRMEYVDTCECSLPVLRQLVAYLQQSRQSLDRLRVLMVGPEICFGQEWQVVQALCAPTTRLLQVYRVSEACIGGICSEANPSVSAAPLHSGSPVAGREFLILDASLQPLPPGVIGDLYIAGAGLARGYLARPDLTAARILPHPTSTNPGARLYRTGERARLSPDGEIAWPGRDDRHIWSQSSGIEREEIEARLRQVAGIEQAAVLLWEKTPGDRCLVAYLQPAAEEVPLSEAQLRACLQRQLPVHMLPDHFLWLERFPLTAHGTLDRHALPAPTSAPTAREETPTLRTPTEEILASLWAEVLALPRVEINENFFELGGQSLLAMRLLARIQVVFHRPFTLGTLLAAPSVQAFATLLTNQSQTEIPHFPPLQHQSSEGRLPLSSAQQQLWLQEQVQHAGPTAQLPLLLHLRGRLSYPALLASLSALIRRHEVVRTSFPLFAGRPFQAIAHSLAVSLPTIDLSQLLPLARQQEQARLLRQAVTWPFSLQDAPLWRILLLRRAGHDHLLLLVVHQSICDARSEQIFLEELGLAYSAHVHGTPPSWPAIPVRYAAYTLWQHSWLDGPAARPLLTFWQELLAGAPDRLTLPCDYPRPATALAPGSSLPFALPTSLLPSVRSLALTRGLTPPMILLAAFALLLARYSGQRDLVIGCPVSRSPETETLLGCVENLLPLRLRFASSTVVSQFLADVREAWLAVSEHQALPFERIVEALQPQRYPGTHPLCQVTFIWQNRPASPPRFAGLDVACQEIHTGTVKFDLTLALQETSSGLHGTIEFRSDLFSPTSIQQMLAHYQVLLSAILSLPTSPVGDLPLLTPDDHRFLLAHLAPPACADLPHSFPQADLIDLFSQQVQRTPDAIALVYEPLLLSYHALYTAARHLASSLRLLGVSSEVRVCLCLPSSPHLVIAILAVLIAGGVYISLDPASPDQYISLILADCQPALLLTLPHLRHRFAACSTPLVLLPPPDLFPFPIPSAPPTPPSPHRLASLIYTTGFTGSPKGVMVSHANLTRLFLQTSSRFQFSANDTWTLLHAPDLDLSLWEIWGALLSGARLIMLTDLPARSPNSFLPLLARQHVTILHQTPSAFRQSLLSTQERAFPHLRLIFLSGETLTLPSLLPWFHSHGDQYPCLVSMYGSPETAVHATGLPLSLPMLSLPAHSPLGSPLPDFHLFVLNHRLQPVPIGLPGELFVSGSGLARGYIGRPDLTAKCFLPHPFSSSPGDRLYRTGDIVRLLPDGTLEFLGRSDHQLTISGRRVETGEIEDCLQGCTGSEQAVVLLQEQHPDEQCLIAYLRSGEEAEDQDEQHVRARMQQMLPDCLVPDQLLWLERFPLAPDGTLDRQALLGLTQKRRRRSTSLPDTPLEHAIASIWGEELGMERVGMDANLLELGVHSLPLIRMHARLQKLLQREIPISDLLIHPTVHELARHLSQPQEHLWSSTRRRGHASRSRPADRPDDYPR